MNQLVMASPNMFYAVLVSAGCDKPELEELIFDDIKQASGALKKYKGSRMKIFASRDKALEFLRCPGLDESFVVDDVASSLEKLSLDRQPSPQSKQQQDQQHQLQHQQQQQTDPNQQQQEQNLQPQQQNQQLQPPASPTQQQRPSAPVVEEASEFPSAKPDLLNRLKRRIEAGDQEEVEQIVWSNPRSLVTVTDSAVYLMAGWKYNACHIAARANKPDIMAYILDTVSNLSFLKKLYPNEDTENLQVRSDHLLDSYLNTPDPKQGNTPLHFACKLGHYKVVRVLLTFEACDTNLKDLHGKTAEEGVCTQFRGSPKTDDNTQSTSINNTSLPEVGDISFLSNSFLNTSLDTLATPSPQEISTKIKGMFRCQLHLPSFRDQLKKRLLLEKRRKKAGAYLEAGDGGRGEGGGGVNGEID